MSATKVAVIGGTGLLGRAMAEEWRGSELVLAGSRQVDIRFRDQVDTFITRHRPDWLVLAAAYTDVDGCELNPELSEAINHQGPVYVAEVCRRRGVRLLFLSTDFVFDGSKHAPYEPDDPVCPLSVYARSKAAAEADLRTLLPDCCIARTSWIFGPERNCFPLRILQWCETRKEVEVVADQVGCPNYNHDLVPAIATLIEAGAGGTVHLVNGQGASWFEFAQQLVRAAGFQEIALRPTTSAALQRPARRPLYSVLSDRSLRAWGASVRPWRDAIPEFLLRRSANALSAC